MGRGMGRGRGELNELIRASTITTNGSERYIQHILSFFQMLILFTQIFLSQFQFPVSVSQFLFHEDRLHKITCQVITGQYSGKWNLISALFQRCLL